MNSFDVAHIYEQGGNLIIIPLESSFGAKGSTEQKKIIAKLQSCAASANLAGIVVPVWETGIGSMSFIAPMQWHSFFSSIDLTFIAQNINKNLTCG